MFSLTALRPLDSRRLPKLILMPRTPAAFAAANPGEAQFLNHSYRSQILYIHPGFDARQPQWPETVFDERPAGLAASN